MYVCQKRGFSLLELMVVIAIIAILSFIAIPVYKNYKFKALVNSVIPTINGFIEQAVNYANEHGRFPTAAELNLAGANGSYIPTGPAANYNPLFTGSIALNDISTRAGLPNHSQTACGQAGFVEAWINLGTGGIARPGPGGLTLTCFMAHKQGVINTKCFYMFNFNNTYGGGFTSLGASLMRTGQTGTVVPGWDNIQNSTQMHSAVLDFLSGSTCM